MDAPNLRRKGLDVYELRDGVLGMGVEIIRSRHGRGVLGWLMGPVAGYYLAYPGEPSLYLTGDSVLTDSVMEAIERLAPDVIIAPAGAANMGLGGDILFSVDELLQIIRKAPGKVVLNHLEALDHCPTTREDVRKRLAKEGLLDRVFVPDDGERLDFDAHSNTRTRKLKSSIGEKPGVQKWMTAPFT